MKYIMGYSSRSSTRRAFGRTLPPEDLMHIGNKEGIVHVRATRGYMYPDPKRNYAPSLQICGEAMAVDGDFGDDIKSIHFDDTDRYEIAFTYNFTSEQIAHLANLNYFEEGHPGCPAEISMASDIEIPVNISYDVYVSDTEDHKQVPVFFIDVKDPLSLQVDYETCGYDFTEYFPTYTPPVKSVIEEEKDVAEEEPKVDLSKDKVLTKEEEMSAKERARVHADVESLERQVNKRREMMRIYIEEMEDSHKALVDSASYEADKEKEDTKEDVKEDPVKEDFLDQEFADDLSDIYADDEPSYASEDTYEDDGFMDDDDEKESVSLGKESSDNDFVDDEEDPLEDIFDDEYEELPDEELDTLPSDYPEEFVDDDEDLYKEDVKEEPASEPVVTEAEDDGFIDEDPYASEEPLTEEPVKEEPKENPVSSEKASDNKSSEKPSVKKDQFKKKKDRKKNGHKSNLSRYSKNKAKPVIPESAYDDTDSMFNSIASRLSSNPDDSKKNVLSL